MRLQKVPSILLGICLLLAACGPAAAPAPTALANPNLILATTTSTQDSGLLDVLVPLFEQQTGYTVKTVAVGTGEALKMGEEGNADVLLVHAPSSEQTFMDGRNGKDRLLVMHNDFIVVGPPSDPAGAKGKTPTDALAAIAAAGASFVSRGDDSGTHKKELDLWQKANIDPAGQTWYAETGQGMGATLTIASETEAYSLTDRATFLANNANLQLEILVEGDPTLLNIYHVITVNPEKWPDANYTGALSFANFLVADATQKVIGEFGVDKYGQQLFVPDAGKDETQLP